MQLLSDKGEWNDVFAMLDELAIVKRRVGGDGAASGACVRMKRQNCRTTTLHGGVSLSRHQLLAVKCPVGARAQRTRTVFYPLTHNPYQDGIRTSRLPSSPTLTSRRRRKICSQP